MSRFEILETKLGDVCVLQRKLISDERGYLERNFCTLDLASILEGRQIVQVNRSLTKLEGSIRGLHFQRPPKAEMKIVTCLKGAIYDVAVDLRPNSPTFLAWHGEILSSENHRSLVIPEGCAHGFQTLVPDSELLYYHTESYAPGFEGGIDALDPTIGISWPLSTGLRSDRDKNLPKSSEFAGIPV